jgi:Ca-activated chloride channel family protein
VRFQDHDVLPLLIVFGLFWLLRLKLRRRSPHSLVHRFRNWTLHRTKWVRLPEFLTTGALVFLGLCLLDPVLSLSQIGVTTRGMNIVMLVDLSSSMLEYMQQPPNEEIHISLQGKTKLDAAKEAILKFVSKRHGDRVGTLVFSERPYVVTPLTLDYEYVSTYMNFVDYTTLAGEGRTAVGEAIFSGLSLIRWKEPQRSSPAVIVIFTDGESNAGRPVYEALDAAHKENVHVYLIGMDIWYLTDKDKLTEAFRATGGDFFDVKNMDQLAEAYEAIDALERQPMVTQQYIRNLPYYYPFAGAALACLLLASFLKAIPYFAEIS